MLNKKKKYSEDWWSTLQCSLLKNKYNPVSYMVLHYDLKLFHQKKHASELQKCTIQLNKDNPQSKYNTIHFYNDEHWQKTYHVHVHVYWANGKCLLKLVKAGYYWAVIANTCTGQTVLLYMYM